MKLLLLSIFISFSYACEDAWKANTGSGCQACLPGQVPNAQQTGCDAVPLNAVVQYGYALVDDVNSCEGHPGHATLDAAGCTEYGNTLNPTQQPITGHRWIEPQGCSLGRGSNLYFTVTGLICGANNFPCVCRSPPVSYTECPPGKIAVNNECVQCDAWKIATSNGCELCPGQVPNADQSACEDVPLNAVKNTEFVLVNSDTCEDHGHTTLDQDGCTEYGNTLTPTRTPSTNGNEYWLPAYCSFKTSGNSVFFYFESGGQQSCGTYSYDCVCASPPVSYTECAPNQFVVNNECVTCTTDQQCADAFSDKPYCIEKASGNECKARSECSDVDANGHLNYKGPNTVESLAFYGCSALQSISMPQVESIEIGAFHNSGLTSISLPKATSIGDNAFKSCTSLTTVDLPLVTTVGQDIFIYCSSLTSLKMDSIDTVGRSNNGILEFHFRTKLQIFSAASATTIETNSFNGFNSLGNVNLPNATTIGDNAFRETTSLTSIELPNAITIGDNAFVEATSLLLPNAITIGDYAFVEATSLTSIELPNAITIETGAFFKSNIANVFAPKTKTIGPGAFRTTPLEIIVLPEATSIASDAGDFLAIAPNCVDCAYQNKASEEYINILKRGTILLYSAEKLKEEYQSRGECPTIN